MKNNNNIIIIQSLSLMTFNLIHQPSSQSIFSSTLSKRVSNKSKRVLISTSCLSYFPEYFESRPKFGLTFMHKEGLRVEVDHLEHVFLLMVDLHHLLRLGRQAYQVAKHHLIGRYSTFSYFSS